MPFNLGIGELIVILVVALLIFGGKLPEVGRSLGRGIVEFKAGLKGTAEGLLSGDDEEEEEDEEEQGAEREQEQEAKMPLDADPGKDGDQT